ncbi:MAG: hypothetical protein JSW46_12195 [Gemmatimonadota bacterium]|nr:MAG: hypothetical protein JSW46_12195 [Gemmatimonadota bacterium]
MRRFLILTAVVASASFIGLACGGDGDDGTGPSPSYENVSGEYVGVLAGTAQGIALDAEFTLTISQSRDAIYGSYNLWGTLSDGANIVSVWGEGDISGRIEAGNNPSVEVRAWPGRSGCWNVENDLWGTYDSTNRVITLSGTVPIIDDACRGYPSTMILYR